MLRIEAGRITPRKFILGNTARLLLAGSTMFGSGCASGVIAPTSSPDNATSISRSVPLPTSIEEPTVIFLTPTVSPTILPSATPEPTATVPPILTVLIPNTPTRIPTLAPPEATIVTVPPVWQGREWPPLSQDVARNKGLHTLYEPGGALDLYDQSSTLIGPGTNFRQQAENAAVEYFRKYANISQILKDTSGYCHGVANAAAYGEAEPVDDSFMSKEIKIGLLAALHSGDKQYKPGKDKLFNGLKEGKRFVIESKDATGFWSRVAYETAGEGLVKATDFDRSPIIISLDDPSIVNMYIPVMPGEEGQYKEGPIVPVGAEWVFNLNPELVYHLVQGAPLN